MRSRSQIETNTSGSTSNLAGKPQFPEPPAKKPVQEKDFGLTAPKPQSPQDFIKTPSTTAPSHEQEVVQKTSQGQATIPHSPDKNTKQAMYDNRYVTHRATPRPYHPRGMVPNRNFVEVSTGGPKNFLWGFLCVILLLFLLGQYTWSYFGDIRKVPALRHLVSGFCPLLGCEVSNSEADVRQIFSVWHSDTKRNKNEFFLKGRITNNSSFVQKVPNLLIKYYDEKLQEISQAFFSPQDFLAVPVQNLEPQSDLDYALSFRLPQGADSFRVMPSLPK